MAAKGVVYKDFWFIVAPLDSNFLAAKVVYSIL